MKGRIRAFSNAARRGSLCDMSPHAAYRNRRTRRLLAVWASLTAIAFQGLVPLGQAVPVGDGSRTLVVCSAYGGTRTISVPASAEAIPAQARAAAACAVCLAYACGAGTDLPKVVALPFPPVAAAVIDPSDPAPADARPALGLAQPRAPPLSA